MIFTFEALPIDGKEVLRQGIMEQFNRDIATVSCAFSTRNFAFIFGEGCFPAIIRVGVEMPHRTAGDVLSELMWIDDLKNDVQNVCQPLPSRCNRMVERIPVGNKIYLATMFRKANGAMPPDEKCDAAYFYKAGALLGKIHSTSFQEYESGFRYKRKHWHENPSYDFSCFDELFEPSARLDAEAVLERIKNVPRDPRWYGMIHGDYHKNNMFCDWDDIWVFDFDDSCYGYFMLDIVCLAHVCMYSPSVAAGFLNMSAHDRLVGEGGVLAQIRAGYSTAYALPDEQWDLFDDFLRLCIAQHAAIMIANEILPRALLATMHTPMNAFLKTDKTLAERIGDVHMELMRCMSPAVLGVINKNSFSQSDA